MLTHRFGPNTRRGFTLVEMLVAIAALGFVMVVILNSFSVTRNTYVVIDNVSETHQNSLAIAALVERDVRMAGYMVHDGLAACGIDETTGPDVLFVSDADAIRNPEDLPASIAGGDLGAEIPNGNWGGTMTLTLSDLVLDEQPTYDEDATAGADSDFQQGGGIIFTNLDDPGDGVMCGVITNVNVAASQVTFTIPTSGLTALAIPIGALPAGDWRAVPAHVYRINGTTLERNGATLANDVEDLQMRWFYDVNDDGQVDAGELVGEANQLNNLALPGDPDQLREIRISLVLRTSEADPENPRAGAGQRTENRTAGSTPGVDGFRRRVYTSTVRLRNITT